MLALACSVNRLPLAKEIELAYGDPYIFVPKLSHGPAL
jgi:hypothetical protein